MIDATTKLQRLKQWSKSSQGLLVLGLVAVGILALLVLSFIDKRTVDDFPLVLTTQQVLEGSTPVFSIPADEANIHYGPRFSSSVPYYMQGFAAGDGGTFWLIDVSRRLLHYSADGALLSQVTIPNVLIDSTILDMEASGSDLWILAFVEPFSGSMPATLIKFSDNGQELAQYAIPPNSTVRYGEIIFGELGEILLYNPTVDPPL